jgi:hypothetical protein
VTIKSMPCLSAFLLTMMFSLPTSRAEEPAATAPGGDATTPMGGMQHGTMGAGQQGQGGMNGMQHGTMGAGQQGQAGMGGMQHGGMGSGSPGQGGMAGMQHGGMGGGMMSMGSMTEQQLEEAWKQLQAQDIRLGELRRQMREANDQSVRDTLKAEHRTVLKDQLVLTHKLMMQEHMKSMKGGQSAPPPAPPANR